MTKQDRARLDAMGEPYHAPPYAMSQEADIGLNDPEWEAVATDLIEEGTHGEGLTTPPPY